MAVGPVRPRETDEMDDNSEESVHDASEEGWETTYGKVKDGAAAEQEKEAEGHTEEDRVGNRHARGPI